MAKKIDSKKKSARKTFKLSVDMEALERLYKKRYVVTFDGGDGDTKSGPVIALDGDGDTKSGPKIVFDGGGDTK